MEQLSAEASGFGLTGAELISYCREQQALLRDDRAREREAERERIGIALEQAKVESEQAKIQSDVVLEKIKLKMAHELALAQLNAGPNAPPNPPPNNIEGPKFPLYREGEDISNFIVRFERIAALLNISQDSYAARLASSLTGKAVDIYASLTADMTENYQALKTALLVGFRKTPDTYRTDFNIARIWPDESYAQSITQLGRKLDLWLSSMEVQEENQSLREFLISDQLFASVSPDLRTFKRSCHFS